MRNPVHPVPRLYKLSVAERVYYILVSILPFFVVVELIPRLVAQGQFRDCMLQPFLQLSHM